MEYVKAFFRIDAPNPYPGQEGSYNPWMGLQHGVQDLPKSMSTIESLVEFQVFSKFDSKKRSKTKGSGAQEKYHRPDNGKTSKSTPREKTRSSKGTIK